MAIAWDELSPADTSSIPAFPANERAFRDAVKNAWDIEHDDANGRHKFGTGNAATRDAITNWVDGSVFLLSSGSAFKWQLYYAGLGGWVDVVPPSNYANRDAYAVWTLPQGSSIATITPGAGAPMTIAVAAGVATHRKVTITANSILVNPSGFTASTSSVITLEVIQNATGGWTLDYDTNYVSPGGATPAIGLAANARSLLTLVRLDNGTWLVSAAASLAAIP